MSGKFNLILEPIMPQSIDISKGFGDLFPFSMLLKEGITINSFTPSAGIMFDCTSHDKSLVLKAIKNTLDFFKNNKKYELNVIPCMGVYHKIYEKGYDKETKTIKLGQKMLVTLNFTIPHYTVLNGDNSKEAKYRSAAKLCQTHEKDVEEIFAALNIPIKRILSPQKMLEAIAFFWTGRDDILDLSHLKDGEDRDIVGYFKKAHKIKSHRELAWEEGDRIRVIYNALSFPKNGNGCEDFYANIKNHHIKGTFISLVSYAPLSFEMGVVSKTKENIRAKNAKVESNVYILPPHSLVINHLFISSSPRKDILSDDKYKQAMEIKEYHQKVTKYLYESTQAYWSLLDNIIDEALYVSAPTAFTACERFNLELFDILVSNDSE